MKFSVTGVGKVHHIPFSCALAKKLVGVQANFRQISFRTYVRKVTPFGLVAGVDSSVSNAEAGKGTIVTLQSRNW